MDRSHLNLPLVLLTALPLAAARIYLLLQANPYLAIFPPLLAPILVWLGHRPLYALYLIVILIPFNAWRELLSQYQFLTLSKLIGLFLTGILLIHLGLVALLMIIFPISKLLHAPGVFFSPTRNQVDNPREARHIAPWALELEKNRG